MKYGYVRVSTRKQQLKGNSIEEQTLKLEAEKCDEIIIEQFSGKTTHRPKLFALINRLKAGDTLVVTKLDRLARNVPEGIELIQALFTKGVNVHILNIGLLENTAMGNFFITVLLAFAEFERTLIYERTYEGRLIARTKNGYREGRPRIASDKIELALELKKTRSYKEVERLTGISKSTLIRYRKQ
ncbi:putative DNA-invertase hin [Phascolarctobacterium sp. CAG:266]|nr:putative DNA-invertase hin [Phascolarctobacterium sp. CAG:266]